MVSFLNDILLRVAIAVRRDCLRRFFTKSLRKVVHPPTVALFPRSVRAQFAKWLFVKKPRLMSKSVATGILSRALLKRDGVMPPSVQDPFTTILSPIMILISWIFYLPIKHRKALLDACRIQAPIWQNKTLSASFSSLPPVYVLHFGDRSTSSFQITNTDLASYFEHVWMFPTLCSLLSYFVRAENTLHVQEFVKEKEISLEKELQAAIWYETQTQTLEYTGLFGVGERHMHPQLPGNISARLTKLLKSGIQRIQSMFSKTTTRPLLPAYNSRKNVSRETCRNYHYSLGNSSEEGMSYSVTTLDLLKWLYVSGEYITGCIEMRQAWFFNDLKPRTYYCLGGTDFFTGMYIQEIANLFMSMLPSTAPFTKFTVSRIGSLNYDELLVTYDYSSFTTSLSELKFFLFWLAEAVGDVCITILDVKTGLKEVPLRDMLHSYNQEVNIHQAFSVERFQEAEEVIHLRQGRNGSLGVKGNIVFSTTLHGLALADITGTPDDDCCVGDDALARVRAWFLVMFISCVNNLGEINPSKFTTIRPLDMNDDTSALSEQYKFLKRPLNLDVETRVPELGTLDFFPSVADALFPEGDGIHSATPGYSHYTAAKTFAMQCGRYFRIHSQSPARLIREEDLTMILGLFQEVYSRYRLPVSGGLPGGFVVRWGEGNERVSDFYCPPLDTTWVFTSPWLEVLLDRYYGQQVSSPITVGGTIPPPLEIACGQVFHATSDVKVLQLCVDLGILEKQVEIQYSFFDQTVCEKIWNRMLGIDECDEPLYVRYEVIDAVPS